MYFKITLLPISVCFISKINIMHEYTETENKYTGKIGTYSMWEHMYILLYTFYVNNQSKYFPCVSKFFPVSQQNSLCFPNLEKVRTKFPLLPVPWPP